MSLFLYRKDAALQNIHKNILLIDLLFCSLRVYSNLTMALTVISIGEESATNRFCLINTFKRKKNKLLKTMNFLKDIAYFSENGVKND